MAGAVVGEAALAARLPVFFENIFNKKGSLMGNEGRLLKGLTEALEDLESAARKFQDVVRAAEMKTFKSPVTNDWYLRLGYAANMADAVLDEALDFVDSNKRVRDSHSYTDYLRADPVEFRRDNLGKKIRSVTRKFNYLDDERSVLNFDQINIKRETVSALSEAVFGREEEKDKIITTLLSNANTHPFIYAIVGLGGIGKTTLAKFIYNDQKVVEQFDTRIWVWVSQTFDVKLVMEKIIETLSEKTRKFESLETTQNHLNELLKGKKFLLVLDDIWNENSHEWNILKSSLKLGAIGSSVLLTTRGFDVASISRVHEQHKIAVLSEDQCWHVFKESAFLEFGELEVIGKQIAKKCGGLPLAAKCLGGSLRLTREVGEWEFVRDSPIWERPQEDDILPSLKLSLESLKSHSKTCFTFCCVFPKGYEMKKEELIQLWMANDLIPPHQRLELEDMGNKIFNDLVLKSFFQVSSLKYSPSIFDDKYSSSIFDDGYYLFTMHDLMHDLCLSFRDDCFCLQDPDVPDKIPKQCLHLSIYSSYPSDILETLSKSHSSLRTCIINGYIWTKINFKNLDCFRALCSSTQSLPISIGKIKDLKYLDLSGSSYLTRLPDSICTLTKLHTLKLSNCSRLTQLPDGITRLVSLRHLELCECEKLTHLPDGIARLVNLRHLNLSDCYRLTQLPDVITGLVSLRLLDLQRCVELTHLPGVTRLVNLRHLDLSDCRRLTQLPDGITRLVSLRHLDLCGCKNLTHLPDGFTRLVNLRLLNLSDCDSLTHLPHGIGKLINLRYLNLSDCRRLTHFPDGMGQLVNLCELAWFSVGRESGQRITELQRMNQLRGSLEIRGLEHVRGAREAEEAILKNKNKLSSLSLIWGDFEEGDESEVESMLGDYEESDESEAESVLEALQPPQSLNEKLVIRGYGGSVFASWMKLLENLIEIELKDCIKCERLPPLGQLPLLKLLTITGMKSLKCIGTEFYGSNDSGSNNSSNEIFPSLVELVFDDMPILEEWQDNQQADSCPCLEQLELSRCPKLTSLPSLVLSFVQKLDIHNCDKVIVRSLSCLTSLELYGWLTESVTSLPEGSLQNLDALESLTITRYNELELSSTDFQHLTKLQTITLEDVPKLTSLPELQHLHSLERLEIWRCENLKMLPQWLKNITSLKVLRIGECHHDLHSGCVKDSGEYWPFIKHIPRVINRDPSTGDDIVWTGDEESDDEETPPTTP